MTCRTPVGQSQAEFFNSYTTAVVPSLTFPFLLCVNLPVSPFILCPADSILAVLPRIMAYVTTRATGYAAISPALKLRRQVLNVRTAKYFAVAIAALMGLFIVYHWARFFFHRYGPKEKGGFTRSVVGWQRLLTPSIRPLIEIC